MIKESIRINKVLKEFNIGMNTLVDFLDKKGVKVEANPNAKLSPESYDLVEKEFRKEQMVKEESKKVAAKVKNIEKENVSYGINDDEEMKEKFIETTVDAVKPPVVLGKIDLSAGAGKPKAAKEEQAKAEAVKKEEEEKAKAQEKKREIEKAAEEKREAEKIAEEKKQAEKAIEEKKEAEKRAAEIEASRAKAENANNAKENVAKPATPAPKQPSFVNTQRPKEVKTENRQGAQKVAEPAKAPVKEESKKPEVEFIATRVETLSGPEVKGSIDLSKFEKKKPFSDKRGKRERIHNHARERVDVSKEVGTNRPKDQGQRQNGQNGQNGKGGKFRDRFKPIRNDVDEDAVQRQIKETYQRMF